MPPFLPRKRQRTVSPAKTVTPEKASNGTNITTPRQKPTLFETADARPNGGNKAIEKNRAFLDTLDGDSDSSLSVLSGSEAADVENPRDDEDEDEEIEWEDAVKQPIVVDPPTAGPVPSAELNLTLSNTPYEAIEDTVGKKKPTKLDRQTRIGTHRMHVQFLLFHNLTRNAWICDKELQKILVDQLPEGVKKEWEKWKEASRSRIKAIEVHSDIEESKTQKGKSTKRKRGNNSREQQEGVVANPTDPLIRFLKLLSAYWRKRFKVTAPGLRKQGYKPLLVLQSEVNTWKAGRQILKIHGEKIRDVKEFRELARKGQGSRDVGAQLFTALVRGLGIESRLVCNLQTIGYGWNRFEEATIRKNSDGGHDIQQMSDDEAALEESENGRDFSSAALTANPTPKPVRQNGESSEGKKKVIVIDSDSDSSDLTELDSDEVEEFGLSKAPKKLTKRQLNALNYASPTPSIVGRFDRDLPYPIYWTECLSPVTNSYIPLDPIVLNCIAIREFGPDGFNHFAHSGYAGDAAEHKKQVTPYVVGFSSDGTAKDLTVRYLIRHQWPGKTKSFRIPPERIPVYNSKGKVRKYEEYDWFKTVMSSYARSDEMKTFADHKEDVSDLVPVKVERKIVEGAETLQGYKNSAEFVLETHMRREEAVLPGKSYVKIFTTGKGEKAKDHKVFRREDVVPCKTSESWHKEGREIKAGEQPLKLVPVRAVTLVRKREIEQVVADGGGKPMQGLYSEAQTDWIIPPPIENGVIPKNAFGNMDCYVPSMVPVGAVHIPLARTSKICRELHIDYAEACTGFEFKAQRAVPVIEGVIVAEENEGLVLEAWTEAEEERRKKEEGKREKICLGLWRKFLMGLRIIKKVREDYGNDPENDILEESNPFTSKWKKKDQSEDDHTSTRQAPRNEDDFGGGFFVPGHEEEELPERTGGEFFPPTFTNHGTQETDEGGGGFIVEHDEDVPLQRKSVKENQPYRQHSDEERARVRVEDKEVGVAMEAEGSPAKTKAPKRRATSAKTPIGKAAKKASSKRKVTLPTSGSPSELDDCSPLCSPSSCRSVSPKIKQRAQPRRAAAATDRTNGIEVAVPVRSRYFEDSDVEEAKEAEEEEEEEGDEDGDVYEKITGTQKRGAKRGPSRGSAASKRGRGRRA
jgi:xeroderma pigmentosum group C-complementing protein